MRFILRCNRYTSIECMLESLKWLNVKQRLKLNTLNFIKKKIIIIIINGNIPHHIKDQIDYVGEMQPYHLRNNNNFRIERAYTVAKPL